MKKIMFVILSAGLFAACVQPQPDLIGIYVNHGENEYGLADDTLSIKPLPSNERSYTVQNRTGFQRKKNGNKMPLEHSSKEWVATWDSGTKILSQDNFGRQIRIVPDGIMLEAAFYKKVK